MLNRQKGPASIPVKNQEIHVTLANGKGYTICSKGQYMALKANKRIALSVDASLAGQTLSEEELDRKLEDWLDKECPFAPVDVILSKMTPAQAEQWKAQYRFGGITRKS